MRSSDFELEIGRAHEIESSRWTQSCRGGEEVGGRSRPTPSGRASLVQAKLMDVKKAKTVEAEGDRCANRSASVEAGTEFSPASGAILTVCFLSYFLFIIMHSLPSFRGGFARDLEQFRP